MPAAVARTTVFLTGKVYWTKILGDPVLNYDKTGREWTFEFEPDNDSLPTLEKNKILNKLRDKQQGRPKYLTLKKPELTRDGKPNEPIRVYDNDDEAWEPKTLIGNGSKAVLKMTVADYGAGRSKGVYPQALKITEHVPYTSSEFGSFQPKTETVTENNQFGNNKQRDTFKEDFGLDDQIPF